MFRSYGIAKLDRPSVSGSISKVQNFPRVGKSNPWHLVDFADFIKYMVVNDDIRPGLPLWSKFRLFRKFRFLTRISVFSNKFLIL